MLQPLDLGIIQNFKVYYCKSLLQFVVAKIDEFQKATDIVQSLTILHAIRWDAQAWKSVNSLTIQKSF